MTIGSTAEAPSEHDHLVGFYADEEAFIASVVASLAHAARGGAAVALIATAEHESMIRRGLADSGIDVDEKFRRGTLIALDAEATVGRLLHNGSVDTRAFDRVIGDAIRSAAVAANGGIVHAFGEMVALLWRDGDVPAAIALEELWNQHALTTPMSLTCGYPAGLVADAEAASAYAEICQLHTGVVGGAPQATSAETARRFPASPHAPRLARLFVAGTLTSWGREADVDDALMVVSELATNAVLHARSDFTVSLSRLPRGFRIVVGDASTAPPSPRVASLTTPGGRGLHLIDRIAENWGHDSAHGGKLIWAELTHRHGNDAR